MGFLDWLTGRTPDQARPVPQASTAYARPSAPRSQDEIAIERYRYLLRTAPPETIEQVHAEAFAQLTPEQRAQVFQELSSAAPAGEGPRADDPASLARAATRAELRSPGTLERGFAGRPGGMTFGSTLASSMLGTIAGFVIGSAIAQAFLPDPGADAAADAGAESGDTAEAGDAGGDSGGDSGFGDGGGWDGGGGDVGGGGFDGGGFGGDFGGGFDF